jgi:hypothetical protein
MDVGKLRQRLRRFRASVAREGTGTELAGGVLRDGADQSAAVSPGRADHRNRLALGHGDVVTLRWRQEPRAPWP